MRPLATGLLCGLTALFLNPTGVRAQTGRPEEMRSLASLTQAPVPAPSPAPAAGLLVGPATVPAHWSRYRYPETIPEGATYYLIVRGDTLWDIAARFLGNPFLWPQIWDANRYITDAHWIYPGDPLIIPRVALVSERAGEEPPTPEAAVRPEGLVAGVSAESNLVPAIEEMALQCAHYVVDSDEDTSLYVIGSEQGATKIAFAERDILYLSKGSSDGIRAGDLYTLHHPSYDVKHPQSGRTIGTKVETTGWVRVILVQEDTATAMVENACADVHVGDYLKPFRRVSVPLYRRHAPPSRLTPPTGKIQGSVVDIADDSMIAGQGQLVTINLGREHGINPSNLFTIFKVMYPSVPTPRNVIGELVVVSVQERTSTARVIYSTDAIMNGDRIELQ